MSVQQRGLVGFYALVAVIALIATWGQNLTYVWQSGEMSALNQFLPDLRVNPAARSIAVDIGLFLLAASAFMVIEARRLGVRFVWLYILLGFLVAISVTFPLFMIAREMRLAAAPDTPAKWLLRASDVLGLALVSAAVIGLSVVVLG
ncbi:MAG: DUF2834 domain-containing protein [Alphaproteobacteria bacterium]|nr:DUF2834 domain-containing protein [Alphaproteobacteria bacterium]